MTVQLDHTPISFPSRHGTRLRFKYTNILNHPSDLLILVRSLNHVTGETDIRPLTLFDTRLSLRRFGQLRGAVNGMHNPLEAELVNEALFNTSIK